MVLYVIKARHNSNLVNPGGNRKQVKQNKTKPKPKAKPRPKPIN